MSRLQEICFINGSKIDIERNLPRAVRLLRKRKGEVSSVMKLYDLSVQDIFYSFYNRPPFLGAGIRAHKIDERTVHVEMKRTLFNRNIVGTHFGGSLYAMCDPWCMLVLMRLLGQDYIV